MIQNHIDFLFSISKQTYSKALSALRVGFNQNTDFSFSIDDLKAVHFLYLSVKSLA